MLPPAGHSRPARRGADPDRVDVHVEGFVLKAWTATRVAAAGVEKLFRDEVVPAVKFD